MVWTPFGADKTGASTINAADLLTFLTNNLLALKAHHDASTGVHGAAASAHVTGAIKAGLHIEAHRTADATITWTLEGTTDLNILWTNPVSEVLTIQHGFELVSGSPTIPKDCIQAYGLTGCTWRLHLDGATNPTVVRGHVIAVLRT